MRDAKVTYTPRVSNYIAMLVRRIYRHRRAAITTYFNYLQDYELCVSGAKGRQTRAFFSLCCRHVYVRNEGNYTHAIPERNRDSPAGWTVDPPARLAESSISVITSRTCASPVKRARRKNTYVVGRAPRENSSNNGVFKDNRTDGRIRMERIILSISRLVDTDGSFVRALVINGAWRKLGGKVAISICAYSR